MGEAVPVLGQGVYGKPVSSQFCCEHKSALKTVLLKKKNALRGYTFGQENMI